MSRPLYGERDYTFGQLMLTLRTQIGLTQAALGKLLHVSRRAVTEWEAGSNYPTAGHLKELIELGVRTSAFPAGQEAQEIRALWRAAHQKVLLDEAWLADLLSQSPPTLTSLPSQSSVQRHIPQKDETSTTQPEQERRVDWGEAQAVTNFYGRQAELATLSRWLIEEGCRMVSVLGMGGIGKSALAVHAMQQLAEHFDAVLFRSLRDAPTCSALLDTCLQVLAPESLVNLSQELEPRLSLLLEELRNRRVLLVLDNLETLLQEGDVQGRLLPDFAPYRQLLRKLSETQHQSCLLLTSREQPAALRALEGSRGPVRSLRLSGLDAAACMQLLTEHEINGSPDEETPLVEAYAGNPLALKIVAETIMDLFGGQITPFLSTSTAIFGEIAELLEEQWGRLSPLEQTVLYWLAILREPVSLQDLHAQLVVPLAPVHLLEAVDGLRRRSLIERGQQAGSFVLQSVVLEYVTGRLITTACQEIQQRQPGLLLKHGFSQALTREYVRQTQERVLLAPLLAHLQSMAASRAEVEGQLHALLDELRAEAMEAQGYGPANLVALLRLLRGNLQGQDLSHLALRGAYLQSVQLQDATLAGALLRGCALTQTFDAIWAVAISSNGQYWATGSKRGEVCVWQRERGEQRLHLTWQAHTDIVLSLSFNPDGDILASGSLDGSIKLWEVEHGTLLDASEPISGARVVAFAPDGHVLASSGTQTTAQLWKKHLSAPVEDLSHPCAIFALAWSSDGHLLATADTTGTLRLWQRQTGGSSRCVQTLSGHSSWVRGLAFAPDGSQIASASWDNTVKLWDVASGQCLKTLTRHTQRVQTLAWSPDGSTLASGGSDHMIWLWDVKSGNARTVLQGQRAAVYGLAFTPDSRHLLSGSEDGTLRLWEVERGQCVRHLQGYTATLNDLDWSPDGTAIASAGADGLISIWDVEHLKPPRVFQAHDWTGYGVTWHPDGRLLASSGWDNALRLWDTATGRCVQTIQDHDHPDTLFFSIAWSPNGKWLASSAYRQGMQMWDMTTYTCRWIEKEYTTWTRRLVWSPDGTRLLGGDEYGRIFLWDASDGRPLLQLAGHHSVVRSVAFSPDGTRLASGSGNQAREELVVWDAQSGSRLHTLIGQPGVISALIWSSDGERLISGGSDGRLRWWEVEREECVKAQQAHDGTVQALKMSPHGNMLASCGDDGTIKLWDLESGEPVRTLRRDRPYERLNITGIKGLTEAEIATLRTLGAVENPAELV